ASRGKKVDELHTQAAFAGTTHHGPELHPFGSEFAVQIDCASHIVVCPSPNAHSAFADLDGLTSHELVADSAAHFNAFGDALEDSVFQWFFHPVNMHAFTLAFYKRMAKVYTRNFALNVFVDLVIDQDLVLVVLCKTFEARGHVYCVADHRVVHALFGSDVARNGFAFSDSDSGLYWLQASRDTLAVVACQDSSHL